MREFSALDQPVGDSEAFQRRAVGVALGAALGLVYALLSQGINHIFLPSIPLFHAPFGFGGNVLLGIVWGAMVGLVCAWPQSMAWGVVLGSIASILVMLLRGLAGLEIEITWLVLIGLALGTPAAVVMLPAIFVLRRAINAQVDARRYRLSLRERLRTPLWLLALIAVLGLLSLYPTRARAVLRRADQSLTQGLAATRRDELPFELAHLREGDFQRDADAFFTLEWTESDLDRFIELRPANNYEEHSAVITRFGNGNTLVCLYPTPSGRPNCAFRPEN